MQVDAQTLAERVKEARYEKGLTQEELAAKAGLKDVRTIWNIEKAKKSSYRDSTIVRVARALGCEVSYLLLKNPPASSTTKWDKLLRAVSETDQLIVQALRDHRHLAQHLLMREYQHLVTAGLVKTGFSVDELLNQIDQPASVEELANALPSPDLVIQVSAGFRKLTFRGDGFELPIESPQLLWDCHCDTPDLNPKEPMGEPVPCPVHSFESKKELLAAFSNGLVDIRWNRLSFLWRRGPEFWPPSVDTFSMLDKLKQHGAFGRAESVVDVGCGTGVLGTAFAAQSSSIQRLDFADWLLTPLLYSVANWARNAHRTNRPSVHAHLGLGLNWTHAGQVPHYDVLLCNPPYLPLLSGFESVGMSSTVAGTELLSEVIHDGHKLAKRVFIQFSHLAAPEAHQAAERAGAELRPLGKPKRVPFRVAVVWAHEDYLRALIDERELIVASDDRHRYWHEINTYEVVV